MRFLISLVIVAFLIFFGVIIFHHPKSSITLPSTSAKELSDYANTSADVKLTIDGIINGDDIHRQIRVTVSASERLIEIIGGYNGNVITSNSYDNNPAAFKTFLQSLQLQGFTSVHSTSITDYQGFCPLGQRYYYQLENTGDSKKDIFLWGSSCGNGTFGGKGETVRTLFRNQIKDYDLLTSSVSL